jgi:hypothetical protein
MTVKQFGVLALAITAFVLLMRTIAYVFDLSRTDAGWLELVAVCVGILGFAWWRRK